MDCATSVAPDRVSTLELFFDLVFVFTITQVATVIVQSPNVASLLRAALELWIICWMYGGYAWLTNAAGGDTWERRVMLLVGMAGFFACALAVPSAFAENALVFGLGYLLVNLVHLTGFLLTRGATSIAAILRLLPWNVLSAGIVLSAAFAPTDVRWMCWLGAALLQFATPFLSRTNDGFVVNATHFAERHGLMILIVIGESVVSVGFSVGRHQVVDASLLVGAMAGFALAAAIWWSYFVGEDARAAESFERAEGRARTDQALRGYGFAHAAMIFGLVAVAAGTKLSVVDLSAPTSVFAAWLIAGGVALFMAGSGCFRLSLHFAPAAPRFVTAVIATAAAFVGISYSASAELGVLSTIVAGALVVERQFLDVR